MSSEPALSKSTDELFRWYQKNKRPLPWRNKVKDPYAIWVAEVMLQQTSVNTVIPYYKKFMSRFKTLKSLARVPLEEVLPYWSGLGYYSRIKNLHKSSQIIDKMGFPRTYSELLKLPGFGPYTARAVSSLAFNEKTGVLDTNVIRVLTRYLGFKKIWWNTEGKNFLQKKSDEFTFKHPASIMNQAMMELGSLICTPKTPLCIACPLQKNCQAYKTHETSSIPLLKKEKRKEIWLWQPYIHIKKESVALTKNHSLPVLKNYLLFPGPIYKKKNPPKHYDFMHSITHHLIYVSSRKEKLPKEFYSWVRIKDIKKKNPSSLLTKLLLP